MRRFGTIEEHPRGSRAYRLRARVGGRLVTIASGATDSFALAARDEVFPGGRSVYFIRAGAMVKIGWSDDVAHRLRELQIASPEKLELLATCPGGRALESFFHVAFSRYRAHGEWFHHCDRVSRCVFHLRSLGAAREAA